MTERVQNNLHLPLQTGDPIVKMRNCSIQCRSLLDPRSIHKFSCKDKNESMLLTLPNGLVHNKIMNRAIISVILGILSLIIPIIGILISIAGLILGIVSLRDKSKDIVFPIGYKVMSNKKTTNVHPYISGKYVSIVGIGLCAISLVMNLAGFALFVFTELLRF